jgi:signal transduction histidine kinase/CheY-like chemotaxis protein
VKSQKPYESEFRLKRLIDGEYRWHLVRAVSVEEGGEAGTRWYGTCTDVTEQKELQAEIQEAKNEAEAANQAKSAFLANMSHEIRTPLGAILGFTDLLKSAELQGEQGEFLNVIERNGHALTRVIDDILDLSKVESGQMTIELVPFSFKELVSDVAALFTDKAKKKGITLELKMENNVPATVYSDPARIRQILINLVGNAIKFTSEGGVQICMTGSSRKKDHSFLSLQIKDTGPGIDEQQRARLFQPFMQADNSTSRKFGGTGLGLALSRRLAKALSGDVRLESSELAKGSVFTFEIEVEVAPAPVAKAPEMRVVSPREEMRANRLENIRILIVDDSPDNRVLMNLILRREGALVEEASDGQEAVRKALEGEFAVVLMDIQMPEMDGYAALAELKKNRYPRPVLALTAHAMTEERRRTAEAGFADHLTKPIDHDGLVRAILNQVR